MSELRSCTTCGRIRVYAVPVCQTCGGTSFTACVLPYPATVWSHTTVFRAPTPALAARVPYTVLLVRGAQGGMVLAPWSDPVPPAIGDAILLHDKDGALVARPT